MISRDERWVIVYNGIIYNHVELRERLGGPWRTSCDTETLLRLLDRQGIDGISALVGMFAFAAWNREDKALFLVRDRIGIKPLYYAVSPNGVEFASEAQAIAALSKGGHLDRGALASYFAVGYPPPGDTLFSGVRAVLPGEVLEYRGGKLGSRRYWQLPERTDDARSVQEWQEEFSTLWQVVAREHLLSDVPVGLFLSGGMDSSAVAIALGCAAPAPRVFSARFSQRQFDETTEAKDLCARLGFDCSEILVDTGHVERVLSAVAAHSDLPIADSSAIGTWLLCEEAASKAKVALSGDGGDEVLAGYLTHRATELLAGPLGAIPRALSVLLWRWVPAPRPTTRPMSRGQKATRFLRYARYGPLEAHLRWRTLVADVDLGELLTGDFNAWEAWSAELSRYPDQQLMNRALAFDLQNYLVQDELVRVDRMSMAHGLEVRVPFLDHRIVELAFRMPYRVKSRGGKGKLPLARWLAAKGHAEIARRPKKGFNHPLALWFRGRLGDRLLDLAAGSPLAAAYRRPVLERWVKAHRSGREDRGYELWSVLVLLEWAAAHGVRL